jgi:hypothetical protein
MPRTLNMKPANLTGLRFGRVLVIARQFVDRRTRWLCLCDCGKAWTSPTFALQSGRTKSCGCGRRDRAITWGKSRATHGMSESAEYHIWAGMNARCHAVTPKSLPYYKDRGITVCAGLAFSFENFYESVGKRPSSTHSIDRKDNNGGYWCGNCEECLTNGWPVNVRWATPVEQANNKTTTKYITVGDRTQQAKEWAAEIGLTIGGFRSRLRRGSGMTEEEAVTTPVLRKDGRSAHLRAAASGS